MIGFGKQLTLFERRTTMQREHLHPGDRLHLMVNDEEVEVVAHDRVGINWRKVAAVWAAVIFTVLVLT